jgi:hypothetical protein
MQKPDCVQADLSGLYSEAHARMQNRSLIMLNAIGEGASRDEPGCGGSRRYGAFAFFPVPLQGTQTFR